MKKSEVAKTLASVCIEGMTVHEETAAQSLESMAWNIEHIPKGHELAASGAPDIRHLRNLVDKVEEAAKANIERGEKEEWKKSANRMRRTSEMKSG